MKPEILEKLLKTLTSDDFQNIIKALQLITVKLPPGFNVDASLKKQIFALTSDMDSEVSFWAKKAFAHLISSR